MDREGFASNGTIYQTAYWHGSRAEKGCDIMFHALRFLSRCLALCCCIISLNVHSASQYLIALIQRCNSCSRMG